MSAQGIGYLSINDEKLKVLVRENNTRNGFHRSLKMRSSGKDGVFFEDESIFLGLKENKDILQKLKSGNVIKL